MNPEELTLRTKSYAHRCVDASEALPNSRFGRYASDPLIRSGMSVGANYRAACRAKSNRDFCAKLGIVEEETDETLFWLEVIAGRRSMSRKRLTSLLAEGDELLRIIAASIVTARGNRKRRT
jgi:four helix bundle protein